jgi:hypothetical protein
MAVRMSPTGIYIADDATDRAAIIEGADTDTRFNDVIVLQLDNNTLYAFEAGGWVVVAEGTAGSDHVADTSAAHAATAVSASSTTLVGVATDVQGVLEELDDEAVVAQSYRPLFSYLTADSVDIQNDTLTASGLSVTLAAGTYRWRALLAVTSDADADINFKMAGTATITAATSFTFNTAGVSGDSTVAKIPSQAAAWNTEVEYTYTGDIADTPFVMEGVVVCTVAGTLIVQFAQGTTAAINTHIDMGSYLEAQRVA